MPATGEPERARWIANLDEVAAIEPAFGADATLRGKVRRFTCGGYSLDPDGIRNMRSMVVCSASRSCSARVVTAAALIMFSIFVAFMFTSDPIIKAIGFSFAVGVFLDAFVVRLTLVPAVMAIIGSRLWYHPRWFARHVPDPDIEGERLEHKLVEGELEPAGASVREG